MPHQCLKCGSVFADGSPEILRGCPECEGTRFFFTEKPLSDTERNRLKEQANKDIKHLIQEMLTTDTFPTDVEEGFLEKDEWVSLGMRSEVEPEKAEVHERSEVEKNVLKSIEDLKFPKETGLKRLRISSKGDTEKVADKTTAKGISSGSDTKKAKKESVAVITISDEGVYDIDVEKLLEDSPIIVQKDGSYLVHLPSVFKKVRKKESMV